jgi:uncharacterized protein
MAEDAVYNPDGAPYVDALGRGVVTVQRCSNCEATQFPPRVHCVACGRQSMRWEEIDGAGTVYAKTVNRRAPEKEFEPLVPYATALVDLDAGVRVLARASCPPDQVVTGMRVKMLPTFEPLGLPSLVFVPATGTDSEAG